MIPNVKLWKVTETQTGKFVLIEAVNKRFARANAVKFGMWGKTVKVSLYRGPFSEDYRDYGFSQPECMDPGCN